ncbi:MAG: GHKL domain-containing protein [Candidatus Omnitrophica bacterium]|nr:GHKL domain-containing protein [Candidatus Omnitrophota bacterium]
MLEEVLANFCQNAYQAVQDVPGEKKVLLRIQRSNGGFVRIEFIDNGCGIAEQTKVKMFEVPTTTKGSAVGTGIGVYRVRQICEIINAKWGVDSDGKGKGARVWVDLLVA